MLQGPRANISPAITTLRPTIGVIASSYRLPGSSGSSSSSRTAAASPHLLYSSAGGPCAPDKVSLVPLVRWDLDGPQATELSVGSGAPPRFGAFLSDADLFDASAFGVSAPEATLMDAQQRLLLETMAEALAGLTAATKLDTAASSAGGHGGAAREPALLLSAAARAQFGVYVGASSVDYMKLSMQHHRAVTAYSATGEYLMSIQPGVCAMTATCQLHSV